jgi:hypothetical protein
MHMLCNAFPCSWIIKLRVQPMHDMMMLKAYQQNLTLSIHVLWVHKVVSKIKMKTFKIARSNTIDIRMLLARIAQGIKGINITIKSPRGNVRNQQLTANQGDRCSQLETLPMKLHWSCFPCIFDFLFWRLLLALEPCLCERGLFNLGFGHVLA